MESRKAWIARGSAIAVALLTACGGGGGGGSPPPPSGGIGVTPPPAPSPPTSPTAMFGALGQTQSQQFPTLGFTYSGVEVGGWGDMAVEPASVDAARAIGLRFDAPAQLSLSIAGLGEGVMSPNGGGAFSGGKTIMLSYNVLGGQASLSLAPQRSGVYLADTGIGSWLGAPSGGGRPVYPIAVFVYGRATLPNEMPASGTRTYTAELSGTAAVASPGGNELAYYSGVLQLVVDFADRTVQGNMEMVVEGASAPYSLAQPVFSADGAGFQATLVQPGASAGGFLEARFAGPAARELMIRWAAPIQGLGRPALAFGVSGAGAP